MVRRVLLRLFPASSTAVPMRLCALAALCLGVVWMLPASASAASYEPVAEYSFDEALEAGPTVEDLAGENDGTIEGGASRVAAGRYGNSLEFPNEGCVSIPNSEALGLGEEFTIEAWVKPHYLETDPIIYKESEGFFSYDLDIGIGSYGKAEAAITPEGGEEFEGVVSPSSLEPHVWTHLAATYDGAHIRLYVDGALVATHAISGATLESGGPLYIGCNGALGEHFEGRIDEVRLYDRVLGEAEVAGDMETPTQTPKAGPVAEYSFDEGEEAGSTVEDQAGENDGTIEGATRSEHGRYGAALEFPNEGCVSIPSSEALELGEEFTIEAWVRPESLETGPIIYKEAEGFYSYDLDIGIGNYGRAEAEITPEGGEEHEGVVSPSSLETHVWTHLAATYDGAHIRLYLNGVLAATHAIYGADLESGGPLDIGCDGALGEHFEGRIDEVRLYRRDLDQPEVAGDMETPIQTQKSGPLAAYAFDEGKEAGETVEDVSGNNHTATIEDGTRTEHGRYGGAVEFDGLGGTECVTVPDALDLRVSEEFTLEAWVRPDNGVNGDPVVVRESGGKDAFGLGSEGEETAGGFIGQGKGTETAGGGIVHENAWSHVATTYDGRHIRVYVNGELVDTEEAPTPPLAGEGNLKIGCDGPDGQFTGRIDEVRFYGRALDPGEVAYDSEVPLQTQKATPVADYSFDEENDETQADTSGDGHTATVEGAEWTPHGRYGGAMEFKAAEEDVLRIPASADLNFKEEFTLEAWVRPSGATNKYAPLIDKQEGGGLGYFLYGGGSESDVPVGAADPGQEHVQAHEPLPANTWSHVALVFVGNRTYLYVDGVEVQNGAAEPLTGEEGELEIGGSTDTADYFDGRIDEVRIYNRGLDPAEVAVDMENPIQTPKQGPIAAWSFDEIGEGGTVEDVTGDEHTGTVEGATLARGKYGEALQFDGENDVVKVPNSSEFDLTEGFTFEAWVRPESESQEWAPILAREIGGGKAASELAWWLYESGHEPNVPYGGTESAPGEKNEALGEDPLPVDAWSHVALTYDGSQVVLYVDGKLVDCSPAPSKPPRVTEGELQIGGATEQGRYFRGRIDEVRIYNRALDDSEILNDMGPHDLMAVATGQDEGTLTRAVARITYSSTGDQRQRSIPHLSLSVSYLGPVPGRSAAATLLSNGLRDVEGRKYLYKQCPYYEGGTEASHDEGGPEGGAKDLKKFTEDIANEGEIHRGCPKIGSLGGEVEWTIEIIGTIRYDRGIIVEAEEGPTCVERGNPEHEEAEEKLRGELKDEPTKEKEYDLKELEADSSKPELANEGCFANPPSGGTKSTNGIDMVGRWHWKPASGCDCLNTIFQQPQSGPQACGELDGHIPINPPTTEEEETLNRVEHFYTFESAPTPKKVQGCYWNDKSDQRGYKVVSGEPE
jgi:hypothetical protein